MNESSDDIKNVQSFLCSNYEKNLPIIDLRSESAFSARRLRGSFNIPFSELSTKLFLLPDKDSEVSIVVSVSKINGDGSSDAVPGCYLGSKEEYRSFLHERGWKKIINIFEAGEKFWELSGSLGFQENGGDLTHLRRKWLFQPAELLQQEITQIESELFASKVNALLELSGPDAKKSDFVSLLPEHVFLDVLDIGCGSGRDCAWLLSRESNIAHFSETASRNPEPSPLQLQSTTSSSSNVGTNRQADIASENCPLSRTVASSTLNIECTSAYVHPGTSTSAKSSLLWRVTALDSWPGALERLHAVSSHARIPTDRLLLCHAQADFATGVFLPVTVDGENPAGEKAGRETNREAAKKAKLMEKAEKKALKEEKKLMKASMSTSKKTEASGIACATSLNENLCVNDRNNHSELPLPEGDCSGPPPALNNTSINSNLRLQWIEATDRHSPDSADPNVKLNFPTVPLPEENKPISTSSTASDVAAIAVSLETAARALTFSVASDGVAIEVSTPCATQTDAIAHVCVSGIDDVAVLGNSHMRPDPEAATPKPASKQPHKSIVAIRKASATDPSTAYPLLTSSTDLAFLNDSSGICDLVLCVRILERALSPQIRRLLRLNGFVLYSTFLDLEGTRRFGRPTGERHLLQPGELATVHFGEAQGFRVVRDDVAKLPDGRDVSMFIAQKVKDL